jgi:alkylation response protein AidB-like acyl-CoA dehydrogenase
MDFAEDPALEAYRKATLEFLAANVTEEAMAEAHRTGSNHDWGFHRAVAATGMIKEGVGSPTRSGRDPMELFTFFNEAGLANAPFFGLASTMLVAGVIEQVGNEFHRTHPLPKLHGGEAIVCLGYSEPGAGSDLASLTTRARRAEDGSGDWIIDGQKMFTTLAHESGYVILLTRTNPDVPKHRGLTMFLVPMDLPGVEIQPVHTMGGDRTNITFYTGVRLGDEWRLGDVDGGWQVMTVALAYERGVFGNLNQAVRLFGHVRAYCENTRRPDGTRLIDDPTVRTRLARIAIDNEINEMLSLRAMNIASRGGLPTVEGSVAKLFASESYNRAADACGAFTGPLSLLDADEPDSPADGWVDRAVRDAPVTTIYGGTSEIQKNLIAERHLGLPRAR